MNSDEPSVSEDECVVCGHWPEADRSSMRILIDRLPLRRKRFATNAKWRFGAISVSLTNSSLWPVSGQGTNAPSPARRLFTARSRSVSGRLWISGANLQQEESVL